MSQLTSLPLQLHADLLTNLTSRGYQSMTPTRTQSQPDILTRRNLIAQGKTAAFGLGLLQKPDVNKFQLQSPGFCPTRETANQVQVANMKKCRSQFDSNTLYFLERQRKAF